MRDWSNILHYKILSKSGGRDGVVYKAEDTKLRRIVALKFLPNFVSSNQQLRKRFEIEAQASASLNHPNITIIHAIEEINDDMFLVLEYIEGEELKDRIKSSPLPSQEIIKIAVQIAEGLQSAHKNGIVHRDIKSGNIMITKNGKVKIMDFGLAKAADTELTKVNQTMGTLAYISPEQLQGAEIDHRTDIWSFGVVLYEMITSSFPFNEIVGIDLFHT
jgi:serine/threonine-protein kinase